MKTKMLEFICMARSAFYSFIEHNEMFLKNG